MKSLIVFAACVAPLCAQSQQAVLTSGLLNPSKLILTPDGNLLVTEAGQTPNSGRVSFIAKSGTRRTLIDGLPSGLAAPNMDVDGPNGLALGFTMRPDTPERMATLYIEIGEGDSFRAGTKANTIVPNPNGPSSPIFASILRLTLRQSIDSFAGSFTLTAQDQNTLADGNPVTLKDAAGDSATLDLLSFFRNGVPDPVSIWRNSHPYAMTLHPLFPGSLFVADAGMNSIVQVSLTTGRPRTLARIASLPSRVPGPPFSEAVPDSIHPYGRLLMVGLLTGFPFTPGASEVVTVDPANGNVAPFIAGLSSTIDVLDVPRTGPRDLFFTLEFSANMTLTPPAPGRVMRYETAQGQVVANGLNGPSSMVYDSAGGNLYVTVRGDGTIVRVSGQ